MLTPPFLLTEGATKPGAAWIYRPQVEARLWIPSVKPMAGTAENRALLEAAGYRRVEPEQYPTRLLALLGQVQDVRFLATPAGLEAWAAEAAIRQADDLPVVLAIRLAEKSFELAPTLHSVLMLPPPGFGEVALIADGKHWRAYSLKELGMPGFDTWRHIETVIKAMAGRAEWWEYTGLMALCAQPGGYDQHCATLDAALKDEETSKLRKQQLRAELRELQKAHRHVQRLEQLSARIQENPDTWQAQIQNLQHLCRQLAERYYAAHQVSAAKGTRQSVSPEVGAFELGDVLASSSLDPLALSVSTTTPALPAAEPQEDLTLLARVVDMSAQRVILTTYSEDRAVREASLADSNSWQAEQGVLRYVASNNLAVYFGDPEHPLPVSYALERLREIRESTILTARIAMSLWNLRRADQNLSKNGAVPVSIREVLELRGIPKHEKVSDSGVLVTDGFRPEYKQAVRDDFVLLAHYHLGGTHVLQVRNKQHEIRVQGPYLHVSYIKERNVFSGAEETVGVFVAPGDWINFYEANSYYLFAEVDRRVFQLTPQNEQHEIRIALFILEFWRQHANYWRWYAQEPEERRPPYELAKKLSNEEPTIMMQNLLNASVISIDRKHLAERFITRIEDALKVLKARGIIGPYVCLNPPEKNPEKRKQHLGKRWLATEWCIRPPLQIIESFTGNTYAADSGRASLPAGTIIDAR